MKKVSGLIVALLTALVIGVGFLIHAFIIEPEPYVEAVACVPVNSENVSIEASAAYVINLKTNEVLYAREAQAQMPLASLTKLMTTLVASEVLDGSEVVTIYPEALSVEGESGLVPNELWRVRDLIDFTLITSSNDGAHALALAVKKSDEKERGRNNFNFVSAMNAKAEQLQLTQTYFLNDTGLDVSTQTAGAYGSAEDVARLLSYVYSEALNAFNASATSRDVFYSVSGIEHVARHTSDITGVLPGEVIAKTGFTDLAGGNLGVVVEVFPGTPIAIVVLNSTREARDSDVATLYHFSREALKRATLCAI